MAFFTVLPCSNAPAVDGEAISNVGHKGIAFALVLDIDRTTVDGHGPTRSIDGSEGIARGFGIDGSGIFADGNTIDCRNALQNTFDRHRAADNTEPELFMMLQK